MPRPLTSPAGVSLSQGIAKHDKPNDHTARDKDRTCSTIVVEPVAPHGRLAARVSSGASASHLLGTANRHDFDRELLGRY